MQKILFLLPSFQLGGTNSSLNNLLPKIDKEKFSIDVYAFDDKGPNRAIVAKYANIIGGNDEVRSEKDIPKRSLKDVVRSIKRLLMKFHIDISSLAFRRVAKQLSAKQYDFVIAFQEGQATKFLTYFQNTYKIAWIHCDYCNYLSIRGRKPEEDIYSKIDKIVCVSKYTRDVFLSVLLMMKDKTEYLHNAMDVNEIIEKSKEVVDDFFLKANDIFRIVSIGRLAPVKRFHLIPQFAATLKKQGYRFQWIIIGGGEDDYLEEIKQTNKKYAVEDCVFCIGAKPNPYPYLVAADMMVILSTSEACPMVLNEAKILDVPVVTTDYGSACEFIENGRDGIICSIDEIPDAIIKLIDDRDLYNRIKNNLVHFKYPNDAILSKFENEIITK